MAPDDQGAERRHHELEAGEESYLADVRPTRR